MNLGRALPAALPAALLAGAALAADRDGFCRDLGALEAHVVAASLALNATNNLVLSESTTTCACGEAEADGSFSVDCALEETYVEGGATNVEEFFERMVFRLKRGEYSLAETSWGSDYDSFQQGKKLIIKREEYYFEDGVLTGCRANACTSCGVCADGKTIEMDCSVGEEFGSAHVCDAGYTGSFANTFDFGTIAGEDVVATPPPDPTDGDNSRDAFCRSLTDLEAHMNESFEELKGLTFLSSFACACGEMDADAGSFAVDCVMEGAEGHITFKSSEHMVFKLMEGKYGLRETSWDWEDSGGSDDDVEESFVLEDGAVAGCRARDCASCGVCDDGKSIAVNCTNRDVGWYSYECGEGYTGSFSHTFDFGAIVETATDAVAHDAQDEKETGQSAIDGVDSPGNAPEAPAADAAGSEASDASAGGSMSTGDTVTAQPDLGEVDVASAPNDALASHERSWMTAPAFFIAAGFLVI